MSYFNDKRTSLQKGLLSRSLNLMINAIQSRVSIINKNSMELDVASAGFKLHSSILGDTMKCT